jgi:hypothetical protein
VHTEETQRNIDESRISAKKEKYANRRRFVQPNEVDLSSYHGCQSSGRHVDEGPRTGKTHFVRQVFKPM